MNYVRDYPGLKIYSLADKNYYFIGNKIVLTQNYNMAKQAKGGGSRKHGRNKRAKDNVMSNFVKGIISGESYFNQKGMSIHKKRKKNDT